MATSKTLLHRVRQLSDDAAWREFFDVYAPLLETYAIAHGLTPGDAEEVRDQCLALVAKKMPDFEYERARGGFKSWLYRIAKGKIIDHLRKPRERQAETRELGGVSDPHPSPDELWERSWRAEHLRYCLEEVRTLESERNFRAFELLLVQEKTVNEVCAEMGMNANQVYKAKSRVLQRVRSVLERLGTDTDSPLTA